MTPKGKRVDEAGRQNSLGLTPARLDSLLDRLERETNRAAVHRENARWPFRQPSITVVLAHPGGSQVRMQMACRNLSRCGAGLLHSTFVYNGTRCVCVLPHPERGPVMVEGTVVRCQHREGVIHEIGVRFDSEIDIRGFVNPNPLSQLFSAERVVPETLVGTLLHVEPNENDRNLLRHFLKDTAVRIVEVSTGAEALEAAQRGVDMVVSEFTLEDMPGSEFVLQLRSENYSKPFVFLTHDTSDRVTNAVRRRMAQAMIRKPLTESTLHAALCEFLSPNGEDDASAGDRVDPALIESLKPEFARCARQIDGGIRNGKPMDVISSCHVLRQISAVVGMKQMSADVGTLIARLSESMEIEPSAHELRLIVEQCRRAA